MDSTPNQILKEIWGYDELRPNQYKVIQQALHGNDVLALLPTGGGKSICFQIPALMKEGICIVVSPLVALMNNQVTQLKELGLKADYLSAGMGPRKMDIVLDNCIYGGTKFLYVSPERLKSAIVKARLKQMKVNFIAVDEAHCISQWGHDFRPAYKEIRNLRELCPDASVIAVTATATKKVATDITLNLDFKRENTVRSSFKRENIFYQSIHNENKEAELTHLLRNFNEGSGIVYIRSRKQCENIAKKLNNQDISAEYYHAGLDPETRKSIQERWMKGKTKIIVSTSAFGMGIDKGNVRLVVHYGMPSTMEEYYQESGRAGRDGKPTKAVIIFNKEDILTHKKLLSYKFPDRKVIQEVYHNIGNYGQIAVGGGKDEGFTFDLNEFAKRYDFHPLTVHYSVSHLENAGYLFTSENTNSGSKLKILQGRKEIDAAVARDNFQGKLLSLLLRSYTGLFNDYVKISESDLASRLSVSVDKIKRGLDIMEQTHIVHYEEQSFLPRLIYSSERISSSNILIPKDLLENRKKVAEEQLEYMVKFATEPTECRTNIALFYFDEIPEKACGNCDNCVGQEEIEGIDSFILKTLSNQPMPLTDLLNKSPYPRTETIQITRILMDKRKIVLKDNLLYTK